MVARVTTREVTEWIAMHRDGWSTYRISLAVGRSNCTVRHHLASRGIDLPGRVESAQKIRGTKRQQVAQRMAQRSRTGEQVVAIARHYGITPRTAYRIAQEVAA